MDSFHFRTDELFARRASLHDPGERRRRSPDFDNLKKPGITHYAIGRGEGVTA